MDSLFADLSALSTMSREKAEKNMQEALNYLGLDLRNIARTMGPYHPLEILKMSTWEERRISRLKGGDEIRTSYAHLLPVLLQSVLLSNLYDASYPYSQQRDIKQKDWNRILSLSEDAAKRLLRYIESYTIFALRSGFIKEADAIGYRDTIFRQFFPPKENADDAEQFALLWYGYVLDDEKEVRAKFGTDPKTLINELKKIALYGIEGIDKLTEDVSMYKAEMLLEMAKKRTEYRYSGMSDEALRDIIVKDRGWERRVKDLQGRRDDFDLMRPEFAADLPQETYETLSRTPGSIDIDSYIKKGLWPATVFPFVRFGNMYFSAVQSHILYYGQRILAENAGLYLRDSAAANAACRLLFSETDAPSVYSFDGNKVDISILSSVTEVNAVENPAFYQARVQQHEEDRNVKPNPGHRLLIIDPDDNFPLEKIGDGIFSSSVYYLIKSANTPAGREEFHRAIFGSLELPEKVALLEYFDEDEVDESEDIDPVDGKLSDEYEYDTTDEDNAAEEEKEEAEIPFENYSPHHHENIEELQEKYELTSEIIKRDEAMDAETERYEREFDDDDYSYEEGDVLPPESDEEEIEDEELYNEVEKEDLYEETPEDSDQKDLFDDLYDDPEKEEASEEETEQEAITEEEEYEKSEKEAEAFAYEYTREMRRRDEDLRSIFMIADKPRIHREESKPLNLYPEVKSVDDLLQEESLSGETEDSNEENPTPVGENKEIEDAFVDAGYPDSDLSQEETDDKPSISEEAEDAAAESNQEDSDGIPAETGEASDEREESKSTLSEEKPARIAESVFDSFIKAAYDSDTSSEKPEAAKDDVESSVSEEDDIYAASESVEAYSVDENPYKEDEVATEPVEESEVSSLSMEDAVEPTSDEERYESSSSMDEETATEVEDNTEPLEEIPTTEEAVPEQEEREEIDAENEEIPVVNEISLLPDIIKEIAEALDPESAFVKFVLYSDKNMIDYLSSVIRRSWEKQMQDGKDKMFSVYDHSLSILISTHKVVMDEIRVEELLNNAGAVMYSKGQESWNALIIEINDDYTLLSAEERKITPASFNASNWKICRIVGEQLIARSK